MAVLNFSEIIIQMNSFIQNCFRKLSALMAWPRLTTSPADADIQERTQRSDITRPRRRSIYTHSTCIMRELNAEERVRDLLIGYLAARYRYLSMEHTVCCSIQSETVRLSRVREVELEQAAAQAKIQSTLIIIDMAEIVIEMIKLMLDWLESLPSEKRVLQVQHWFVCAVPPQTEPLPCPIKSLVLKHIVRMNKIISRHNCLE